ncbi:hypothetical protein [Sphingomonas sp.]|uniref:hypothetical protein n=1 Tax=Sphingomonas sp. TaxID=28214 RepID=UPI003D6D04E2
MIIYANTVSTELTATNTPQYTNGVRGFLMSNIARLFRENSAVVASEMMQLNSSDVKLQTAKYAPTLPFPTSAGLFTSTNFYTLKVGMPLTLRTIFQSSPTYDQHSYVPTLDDFEINTDSSASSQYYLGLRLVSVSVPQDNSNDITAKLQPDGTIVITPSSNFRNISYFDYVAASRSGVQQSGRAFVTAQP